LDPPSGPLGRRARWHQIFSKFDLSVGYIPGKENEIADILSRWAYPASEALRDVSRHGNAQDTEEMKALIKEEYLDERNCLGVTTKEVETHLFKCELPQGVVPQPMRTRMMSMHDRVILRKEP
jgi:hypothetical protein